MLTIILLLLFVAGLGLLLLLRGRHGIATDDHPLCRKCGFDLTGKPEGSNVCSECGSDLSAPKAIRIGHRRPRGGLVMTGCVLLLLGLGSAGAIMWAAGSSTNWQARKPVWWLIRETKDLDVRTRDAALAELSTRLGAGKLTDPQIDALCDQGLAVQGDANAPWSTAWGDLLETARTMNKLSDDRWQKYARQAPAFVLDVRPEVRKGDRIYHWLRNGKSRVGSRTRLYVEADKPIWQIGPIRSNRAWGITPGGQLSANGSGASGTGLETKSGEFKDVPPGKYPVKYTTTLKIVDGNGPSAPIVTTAPLELTATVKLLPADQPTVRVINDPALGSQVAAALSVTDAGYARWSKKHLNVSVNVNNPPVGVGFDIYARIDGKETKLSSFAAPAGKRNSGWGAGGDVENLTASRMDVVLRPSTQAATNTTNVFEIWDGEVVISDVAIQNAATNPAVTQPTASRSVPGGTARAYPTSRAATTRPATMPATMTAGAVTADR